MCAWPQGCTGSRAERALAGPELNEGYKAKEKVWTEMRLRDPKETEMQDSDDTGEKLAFFIRSHCDVKRTASERLPFKCLTLKTGHKGQRDESQALHAKALGSISGTVWSLKHHSVRSSSSDGQPWWQSQRIQRVWKGASEEKQPIWGLRAGNWERSQEKKFESKGDGSQGHY